VDPPPVSPDDLYSANADLIERVLERSCRAHRLPADTADEFRSWARLRLFDHDQAILRKFGGRSTLRTFLLTVVERLFLDWRNHEWGKWRPSNQARRLGDLAIELEKLVLRDHYTVHEAVQTLVARGLASSELECERLWARLPRRPRRQRVEEEQLAGLPAPGRASDAVEEAERRAQETVLVEALERVILALPAGDQIVLRLRFWSGFKISRIAELIGEDPKALYRRFDRACVELKLRLDAEGVRVEDVAGLLGTFIEPDRGGPGA
jgi:RNA polymerase sigma factor (sigma-70 family)